MVTRAKKVAGGYRLSGAKTWISNSPIADVFVVWAKLDDDGRAAILGFVLEKGWKGLSAPAIHVKVGTRATLTGGAFMYDVFVDLQGVVKGKRLYVRVCLGGGRSN